MELILTGLFVGARYYVPMRYCVFTLESINAIDSVYNMRAEGTLCSSENLTRVFYDIGCQLLRRHGRQRYVHESLQHNEIVF